MSYIKRMLLWYVGAWVQYAERMGPEGMALLGPWGV